MISIKNVIINKNKKPVLKNVSLEVADGDFIVVSGKNALERETLISTMGMLEKIESGEVFFNGIEQSKYSYSQSVITRRDAIGFMLSDAVLDETLSVLDNIELPLLFAGKDNAKKSELANRALGIVGLVAFKDVQVKNLNDWQKNKVLLARTFVNLPKVVIFSEPCRVDDEQRLVEVLGLMSALNKDGVTVIVASNRPEYIKIAKRNIEVVDGMIIEHKKEKASRQKEEKNPRRTKTTTKKPRAKKSTESKKEVGDKTLASENKTVEPVEAPRGEMIATKPKSPRTRKTVAKENQEAEQLEIVPLATTKKAPKKRTKKEGEVNNAN